MRILFSLAAILLGYGCLAQSGAEAIFDNHDSWDQVRNRARSENKYIFVDVFATWCGPCKAMDQQVYPNDTIAALLKAHFISVKLQMDSTGKDNDYVRSWYADARRIAEKYQPAGYPSFLFFSPGGELVMQELGYKSVPAFIAMSQAALDPERTRYTGMINDYQNGARDYTTMGQLAIFARNTRKDEELAGKLSREYKKNYLDKCRPQELLTPAAMSFIKEFPGLVGSQDRYFKLCYDQPALMDSLIGINGWAHWVVDQSVTREEIAAKAAPGGKRPARRPDFQAIRATVARKYPKTDARLLVMNYQLNPYYLTIDSNWKAWAKVKDEKVKAYPMHAEDGTAVFIELNGWAGAWLVFMRCTIPEVLRSAVNWVDEAIRLQGPRPDYLDTKANLLYKLGEKDKAIGLEKEALTKENRPDFINTIAIMEKGQPTYLDQGAIWSNTSPAATEKKVADISVVTRWPELSGDGQGISPDGRWVWYIRYDSLNYSREWYRECQALIIKSLSGKEREIRIDGWENGNKQPQFTADGKRAIYLVAKEHKLWLQSLDNDNKIAVDSVRDFQLLSPEKQEYLFYQTMDGQLVLHDWHTGSDTRLGKPQDHWLDEKGNLLFLLFKQDSQHVFLQRLQLPAGQAKPIWEGKELTNFVLNKTGNVCAFVGDKTIRYLDIRDGGTGRSVTPAFEGMEVAGLDHLSADGRLLFFKIKEKSLPAKYDSVNRVEVWSYQDAELKTEEKNIVRDEPAQEYLAVADCQTGQITRIQHPFETVAGFSADEHTVLMKTRQSLGGFNTEYYWNPKAVDHYFMMDLPSGRRYEELKTRINTMSPNGNFVVGSAAWGSDLYLTEKATGRSVDLTGDLPIPKLDNIEEVPETKDSRGLYFVGWLSGDQGFLVCDRFDIWQLDPHGKRPPLNLTSGIGRKAHIEFKFIERQEDKMGQWKDGEAVVVTAFNEDNKDNGFYRIRIGRQAAPELLTMGPYVYEIPWHPANWYGMAPVKAGHADVWLVRRSSASESPNLFRTADFKTYQPVSNIHPEKNYHWYTTKLIHFTTEDGIPTDAILYTPDNFDSTKKYPVLFNYYMKKTDLLNAYMVPWFTYKEEGAYEFNFPLILAKGYLICVPDIHFTPGETARNITHAVEGAAIYLSRLPYVDSAHFGICGGSFGGYGTNCIAALSHRFAAAVPISGMSDFVSEYGSQWGGGASKSEITENRQGNMAVSLAADPQRYLRNSPVVYARDVTTPILIVNTLEDGNVGVQQGIEWFTSLRREGKRAWMLRYQHRSHGVPEEDLPDFYIRMNQFFDHYLKGAPAPVWMTRGIPARDIGVTSGFEYDPEIKTPGAGLQLEDSPPNSEVKNH